MLGPPRSRASLETGIAREKSPNISERIEFLHAVAVPDVQPRVVMETLGHSQVSLTLDQEENGAPADIQEAADSLEKVVTLTFASWNLIGIVLGQIDSLRGAN